MPVTRATDSGQSPSSPRCCCDLHLVDARIVDPVSREIRTGNLLIRDGVIVSAPPQALADFAGATLDVDGRRVMPDLVDLHTHTFSNVDADGTPIDAPGTPIVALRMLYAGVTAFLDLGGDEQFLVAVRRTRWCDIRVVSR